MKISRTKIFALKKPGIYGLLLAVFLLLPTSFAFASGSGPGFLADTMTTLMAPFHFLATAAGTLMGVTMYYTVVRMGYYVHQLGALQTAWELFRDLGNILIVFGFIAIGIATILDNATYGAKKALPKLLIVAVLLNFSLFFAEFVVDAGNVFATQFYASINGGSLPASASTFSVSKEPISGAVLTLLKTTGLYQKTTPALGSGKMIELALISIIMFIIMAFVFFAIAIMLISRFVVLLFLFIVSPIGFIGLAGIPLISSYGKKWWAALTNQTLLAPILFLFLLVVTKMIQSGFMQTLNKGTSAGAISSGNVTSMANILLSFSVVMGLLFTSLIVAKSLSGKAANFAVNQSRKRMAQAFSLTQGGGARILRGAARMTGDNKFSRGVGHVARIVERSNFDMVGKLGGKQFLGMGEAGNTSYKHISTHLPIVGEGGYIEREKKKNLAEMSEEKSKADKRQAQRDIDDAIKKRNTAEENKKRDPDNAQRYDDEIADTDRIISSSLSSLSIKEISELKGIKNGVSGLAQNFSPEKFAMLMKDGSISDRQKGTLRSQRYEQITQATGSNNTKLIKEQSVKDLEQYAEHNPEQFKKMGEMLSNSQADALQKSGLLSVVQRRDLKEDRNDRFNTVDGAKGAMDGLSLGEIAKLPTNILIKPTTLEAIPYGTMRSLLNDPGNLSPDAQEALTKHAVEEMKNGTDKGIKLRGFMEGDKGAAHRWGVAQPKPEPKPEESKIIIP